MYFYYIVVTTGIVSTLMPLL